jgi:hypothetical protein
LDHAGAADAVRRMSRKMVTGAEDFKSEMVDQQADGNKRWEQRCEKWIYGRAADHLSLRAGMCIAPAVNARALTTGEESESGDSEQNGG